MNRYEVAVVFSSKLTDEARISELELVKGYITKYGGTISEVDEWGKKKLAYEIRKETEGYFCFIKVDAVPEMAVELEKEMRLRNETVLRYLILREGE